MAKKPQPALKAAPAPMIPESFEPERLYKVRVGRTCSAANTEFSPAHAIAVKGKVAEQIREHLVFVEAA